MFISVYSLFPIFDLDIWPQTSKIDGVHSLLLGKICAKFDKNTPNSLISIVFTRLHVFHLKWFILLSWTTLLLSWIKIHWTVLHFVSIDLYCVHKVMYTFTLVNGFVPDILNGSDIHCTFQTYRISCKMADFDGAMEASCLFKWMRVVLTNRDTSRNPQSIELTDGAQVFLGQCFSYVEKAAPWQRTCQVCSPSIFWINRDISIWNRDISIKNTDISIWNRDISIKIRDISIKIRDISISE